MTEGTREAVEAALAAQALPRAVALADAAVSAGSNDPLLLHIVGWQRAESGALPEALALLTRARATDPDDPSLATTLAQVLRRLGRLSEALVLLDAAIASAPDDPVSWIERGFALDAGGSLALAAENYAQAVRLDPAAAAAHAGLAMLAARQGDWVAARDHGWRALAIEPANPVATCAIARSEIDAGQASAAEARLRPLLAIPGLAPENAILVHSLIGDARDRQGDVDAAFAAYTASNAAFSALHQPRRPPGTPSHRQFIARIDTETVNLKWRAPHDTACPVAGHGFLLGYPRSGTTLVETILGSADGVETLEERPTLHAAAAAFLEPADGLQRLATADDKQLADFCSHYWRAAAGFGAALERRTLIDMDPLKGLMLPLIGRMFPAARIIVMRRDPRDIVLSCFRCNFAPTSAALEFVSLERTARHYDALMRLTERCLAVIPNPVHVLRYDDLVEDFDATTRSLCEFLGLDWTPALRDFAATARKGGVATASAAQVRRGLYNGSGQWRRYEKHLQPVMPILDHWIKAFGYIS